MNHDDYHRCSRRLIGHHKMKVKLFIEPTLMHAPPYPAVHSFQVGFSPPSSLATLLPRSLEGGLLQGSVVDGSSGWGLS